MITKLGIPKSNGFDANQVKGIYYRFGYCRFTQSI